MDYIYIYMSGNVNTLHKHSQLKVKGIVWKRIENTVQSQYFEFSTNYKMSWSSKDSISRLGREIFRVDLIGGYCKFFVFNSHSRCICKFILMIHIFCWVHHCSKNSAMCIHFFTPFCYHFKSIFWKWSLTMTIIHQSRKSFFIKRWKSLSDRANRKKIAIRNLLPFHTKPRDENYIQSLAIE